MSFQIYYIFDNKQSRGSYGDKWLEEVVKDAIPKKFYKFQETLSNGKRVDCLLDFGTKGTAVAIDAKFPMPKKLTVKNNIMKHIMVRRLSVTSH